MTEIEYLKQENAALQAQLDRLMLEFCPGEMTSEQLANWVSHQRSSPMTVEINKAIDTAMNEYKSCSGQCSSCNCN